MKRILPKNDSSSTKFSPSQQQAIYDTGDNLLVSAAAGSGKTTILVERVIQKILSGTNVDELLIVTFTEAAADEVKSRIKFAIHEQLLKKVETDVQTHLVQQLHKLELANISTFHAFCLSVIRRFFYLISLEPTFRMLVNEVESALLKDSVWDNLVEIRLKADKKTNFQQLISLFSSTQGDLNLREIIFNLYEFARVNPEPKDWLTKLAKFYLTGSTLKDTPIYQNYFQNYLLEKIENINQTYQNFLIQAEKVGNQKLEELTNTCLQVASSLKTFLLEEQFEEWDASLKNLKIPAYRFSKKAADYEEVMALKPFWDEAKDEFNNLASANNFLGSNSPHFDNLQKSQKIVHELSFTTLQFYEEYSLAKKNKNLLDFNDLEHFTLQILKTKSSLGDLEAQNYYQKKFNEILIDEYQDVNRLQIAIVDLVSRDSNRFLVGDVKQSIYGFRLACPAQFVEIFDQYQREDNGRLIVLAQNYRSRQEVLDFTNLIFMQIMDKSIGQVVYDEKASLALGNSSFPKSDNYACEILIYESEKELVEDGKNLEKLTGIEGEIHLVAQKISELISEKFLIWDKKLKHERSVRFSDFAILISSKGDNLLIQKILADYSLPTRIMDVNTYFQTTEIQTMMSLLEVIDNPYQDIPLVGVLRSPIVNLKERELGKIRLAKRNVSFWQALNKAATDFPKVQDFLEKLADWRDLARKVPLATLLWDIYEKTAYLDYVGGMPNGETRKANLYALVEKAVEFDDLDLRGLFQFVRFINKIQEKDHDLAEATSASHAEEIEVMTIHKSKGLEFPIVFVLNLGKKYNRQDLSENVLLDEKLGIGIQFLDLETRFKFETIPFLLIKQEKSMRLLSEEYRKLYVALTRAEQKLFLVGSFTDFTVSLAKWAQNARSQEVVFSVATRLRYNNFLDLIMTSLMRHRAASEFNLEHVVADLPQIKNHPACFTVKVVRALEIFQKQENFEKFNRNLQKNVVQNKDDALKLEVAKKRLNFEYGYPLATKTAACQSVTELKRFFEDRHNLPDSLSTKREAGESRHSACASIALPKFLGKEKIKPTDIGVATHLLLQVVDLSKKPNHSVFSNLLQQLVKGKIISEEIAKRIDLTKLVQFFSTDFGGFLLKNEQYLHREERFSMLINPQKIYSDYPESDDQILIHATIDGFLEFNQTVVLFDYKTDYLADDTPFSDVEKLKNRYQNQVTMYSKILENALQKKVVQAKLIFLCQNYLVEML